jgi:hypothetical protein
VKKIKKDLMKDKMISSLPALLKISTLDDEASIYIEFKK